MAQSTKTPAQRARVVERWRASGVAQAAFARQVGLHPRTFWGWCRQTDATRVRATPRFVPVQVEARADEPGGAPGLEIVLASGVRVRVAPGTSPTWVAAVVTALRPVAC